MKFYLYKMFCGLGEFMSKREQAMDNLGCEFETFRDKSRLLYKTPDPE